MAIETWPTGKDTIANGLKEHTLSSAVVTPESQPFERLFGPENLTYLPLSEVNMAGQYRVNRDQTKQQSLKESIERGNLEHPLSVVETDPITAMFYVDYTNASWHKNIQFSDLTMASNGNYYIVAAGHGRTIAIREIVGEAGADAGIVGVMANLRQCVLPSGIDYGQRQRMFLTALKTQVMENISVPIEDIEEAFGIKEMYLLGKALGEYTSLADFVRKSTVGSRKAYNAVRFFELPLSVQSLVTKDSMHYTQAVALYSLIDAFRRTYMEKGIKEDDINLLVEGQLLNIAEEAISERWTVAKTQAYVKVRLQELEAGSQDLTLYQLTPEEFARAELEEIEKRRSERVKKEVVDRLNSLAHLLVSHHKGETKVLHPEMQASLQNLGEVLEHLAPTYTGHTLEELMRLRSEELEALVEAAVNETLFR